MKVLVNRNSKKLCAAINRSVNLYKTIRIQDKKFLLKSKFEKSVFFLSITSSVNYLYKTSCT